MLRLLRVANHDGLDLHVYHSGRYQWCTSESGHLTQPWSANDLLTVSANKIYVSIKAGIESLDPANVPIRV